MTVQPVTVLHRTDPLGLPAWYYRSDGQAHGPTIRELLSPAGRDAHLDAVGFGQWLDKRPDGQRTCFQAIRCVPGGCALVHRDDGFEVLATSGVESLVGETDGLPSVPRKRLPTPSPHDVLEALSASLHQALSKYRRPALALSGGLDSALLLALLRRLDGPLPPVYTLNALLDGYGEIEWSLETACWFGATGDLVVVPAAGDDFIAALPATVRACETPLYNAHPVSKWLLAQAVASAGHDAIITGDGADQVFAGVDGRDYLPLVGSIFRAAGLALCTPFTDSAVAGLGRRLPIDPAKTVLREAARGLVPPECLNRPKRPTLTPPLAIDAYVDRATVARLAGEMSMSVPTLETDSERMLWATLSLLVQSMSTPASDSAAPNPGSTLPGAAAQHATTEA